MTSRREAVKALAALAAAGLAPRAARAEWEVVPPASIDRLGLQLYTVRSAMQQDMPATLAAVAKFGYREVEFAGYFGRTPIDASRCATRCAPSPVPKSFR